MIMMIRGDRTDHVTTCNYDVITSLLKWISSDCLRYQHPHYTPRDQNETRFVARRSHSTETCSSSTRLTWLAFFFTV